MFLINIGSYIGYGLRYALRAIVATLDMLIYNVDALLYNLVLEIADAEVFSSDTIQTFAGRVYQLLALIMAFRLVFLFITYIINPDDMADKTKGYQNIVKKIIITLFLIIVTPWAFDVSRKVQKVVLREGVIEYFVFGTTEASESSAGNHLMYTIGKMFIVPYKCVKQDCEPISSKEAVSYSEDAFRVCDFEWEKDIKKTISCGSDDKDKCERIGSLGLGTCGHGIGKDANGSTAKLLYKAANDEHIDSLFNLAFQAKENGQGWNSDFFVKYNFPFIGSTLIGLFVGYMLLVMCFDIALRSIKLGFYELMAPIPIIAYIGPKDGKDSMLSKWFSQVIKTYADLFVRVAGLQLAVFFINLILKNGFNGNRWYVALFLIVGALIFAKKLPDILKDLGINFDGGGFSLKKKLADAGPAGKVIGAGLGAAGGLAATGLRNALTASKRSEDLKKKMAEARAARESGDPKYKNLNDRQLRKKVLSDNNDLRRRSLVRGATSGFTGGFKNTKDGGVLAGARAGVENANKAADKREKRRDARYGVGTSVADSFRAFAGVKTQAKKEIEGIQREQYDVQREMSTNQSQMNNFIQNGVNLGADYNDLDTRQYMDKDGKIDVSKMKATVTAKSQEKVNNLNEAAGKLEEKANAAKSEASSKLDDILTRYRNHNQLSDSAATAIRNGTHEEYMNNLNSRISQENTNYERNRNTLRGIFSDAEIDNIASGALDLNAALASHGRNGLNAVEQTAFNKLVSAYSAKSAAEQELADINLAYATYESDGREHLDAINAANASLNEAAAKRQEANAISANISQLGEVVNNIVGAAEKDASLHQKYDKLEKNKATFATEDKGGNK